MAQYAVLLGDTTQLVVLKATSDPNVDGNWSSVAHLSVADPIRSLWAVRVGTDIHIATAEVFAINDTRWAYHKLNTLTDTWTIKDEEISTNATISGSGDAISLAVRDDGDVIVLYNVTVGGEDKVFYARREATVWTVDIQVSDTTSDDWSGAVIVKGSSDRMHFFFKNDTLADAFQRTLTSANVLETFPAAGDSDVSGSNHVFVQGMSYDDGGTQRIRCPYADVSPVKMAYAEFDSVDAPGAFTPNTLISDNLVSGANDSIIACTANDGTDEHLLYSNSDDSEDLYHDKNKGADVEELDAVDARRISCNVYDRSGTKLAFVWLDGTTTKYGEVDIAGVTPPIEQILNRRRPVRTVYV